MKRITRLALTLLLSGVAVAGPALAKSLYEIKPQYTTIGFMVDHLGVFSTEGRFGRFEGSLLLDLANPERSQVNVKVDTTSVEVGSDETRAMLISPDYFNTAKYPEMQFRTVSIAALADNKVRITGDLTIRDITRPQVLEAELTGRRFDARLNADVADFVASGVLERSAFGMVSDEAFVSDDVVLRIRAHIQLAPGDAPAPGQ